jgi:hypothetical protein
VPAVVAVRKAAAHMLLKYTCNIYYNFIPATMDIILSKADMTVDPEKYFIFPAPSGLIVSIQNS